MAKAQLRWELISQNCSFRTLLTTASCLGLFLTTTRHPLHGHGFAKMSLSSIPTLGSGVCRGRSE